MKKVTLCAFGARYSHSNMALHCLKSAVPFDLQKNIKILELTQNDRLSYAVEKIAEGEPDAVGFSCYIWSIDMVLRAASSIKKILPGCLILLGGPEAGPAAQVLMERHSFHRHANSRRGRNTVCRVCNKIYQRTKHTRNAVCLHKTRK